MNALRPLAKVGIVLLGLGVAAVIAGVAVAVRDHFFQVPAVEKAGGMYAFGNLLAGIAVFGVAALVPIALALYWLRPVERFWSAVTAAASAWAVTSLVALAVNRWFSQTPSVGMFLAQARVGIMPLTALALLTCAVFAPLARHRWLLASAATADGLIFIGVGLVLLSRK